MNSFPFICKCLICDMQFKTKHQLNSHLYNSHSKIVSIIPVDVFVDMTTYEISKSFVATLFEKIEEHYDTVNCTDTESSDEESEVEYEPFEEKPIRISKIKCDTCGEFMHYNLDTDKMVCLEATKKDPELIGAYLMKYKEAKLSERAAEYRTFLKKLGMKMGLPSKDEINLDDNKIRELMGISQVHEPIFIQEPLPPPIIKEEVIRLTINVQETPPPPPPILKEEVIRLTINIQETPQVPVLKIIAPVQELKLTPPEPPPPPFQIIQPTSKQVTYNSHTFTRINNTFQCNQCLNTVHSTKACKCHVCLVKRCCDVCGKLFPTAKQYKKHIEDQSTHPIAVPKTTDIPILFDLSPLTLPRPITNIEAALQQLFTIQRNQCIQEKVNGVMVHVGCGTWMRRNRKEVLEWVGRSLKNDLNQA